ncbi:MAG: glycosyltransferase, partial [Candidatus Eremiobacteraeota bacterium]|nr:glycosyltransferase [Candidatus Eremiobacteraeota bacterium]
ERLGLEPESIVVIPHATGLDVPEAPLARPPARPGPVVGWNGRLSADRSWETLIDGFALVHERIAEARLGLAGSGRARQFIAAYVRERKLSDVVTFLGEVSPRELFATIDMLAVPISRDSMPHAPLEALVAGVPIVGANLGALADVLGVQDTAWLVPDDADGFRDGILDAWSRIDDAWLGAAAQRAAARATYGRDVVTAAYEALYESAGSARAKNVAASDQAISVTSAT